MKAYITTTIVGCFALDENKNLIDLVPFEQDPSIVLEKLSKSQHGLIEEEKELLDRLEKKGYSDFVFEFNKPIKCSIEKSNNIAKYVRKNLRRISIENGIFKTSKDFNDFLVNLGITATKDKIRKSISSDRVLMHMINAIEEIDKSLNVFTERLREVYSLHFPELDKTIDSNERFTKLVVEFGHRNKIEDPKIKLLSKESVGAELSDADLEIIRVFAKQILELYKLRENLIKYVEDTMRKIAPNLSEITPPLLGAKLITKAGSLEKLAKTTSSTIQLLGAEKSLFRYLHGKGKSPRFGILALHPLVMNAPEQLKGKVARSIASKISIAAKIDFYSKDYRGKQLKKDLDEKIKKIMKLKD